MGSFGSFWVMFWKRVVVGEPDDCWFWRGKRTRTGYGVFVRAGRHVSAHRAALEWRLGREVVGWALHRCDVRSCVNPAHVYEGDARQNALDRMARSDMSRLAAWHRSRKGLDKLPA